MNNIMLRRIAVASLFTASGFAQTDFNEKWSQALRGGKPVPAGFTVTVRNGSAQALTANVNAGTSAKAAFSAVFKQVTPYFDRTPVLQSAFGDPQDHQVQAFFRTGFQGVPIRGLMVVNAQGAKSTAAILFDREDQFAKSLPALSKQMSAAMPKSQAGGAPQGPPQLIQTRLSDGSGTIGLPKGWQMGSAYKGAVDVSGPEQQFLLLGVGQQAFRNAGPNSPLLGGSYRPPAQAWALYADHANKGALSRGQASLRIVEQVPAQYQGGLAAWIGYEFTMDGKKSRGVAYVVTSPLHDDIGSWYFYSSYAVCRAERFAQDFPVMWDVWKSWSINPAVFRERMDATLRSMRETFAIMQDIHRNTQRAYDSANLGWDETIRGVTMIEDVSNRSRAEVDTNHVDWWVEQLNKAGYPVRVVPVGELIR